MKPGKCIACDHTVEVTPKAPVYENALFEWFGIGKSVSYKLRSRPIETNSHSAAYSVMLKSAGLNRAFVLTFEHVNTRNYRAFLRNPKKYVTLSDMCLVHSVTGISIDRQIQSLLFGLTEAELTRKGSRLIGSLIELSK